MEDKRDPDSEDVSVEGEIFERSRRWPQRIERKRIQSEEGC